MSIEKKNVGFDRITCDSEIMRGWLLLIRIGRQGTSSSSDHSARWQSRARRNLRKPMS